MITLVHHQKLANGCDYATVKTDDLAEYDACKPSYALGYLKPNYPLPAIPPKHKALVLLGYVSAENGFSIDAVFDWYVRL